jgi:GMP synthase-like glutamine amidotransferase
VESHPRIKWFLSCFGHQIAAEALGGRTVKMDIGIPELLGKFRFNIEWEGEGDQTAERFISSLNETFSEGNCTLVKAHSFVGKKYFVKT